MNCLMAMQLHQLAVVVVLVASFSCSILWVEAEQQLQPYIPFQDSKFQNDFFVEWSQSNVAAVDGGHTLQLSLNEASGTAVSSTNKFLFGYIRASIKLISGNSAGTVTTFYLSSTGEQHDEVDFEFLGNKTGEPYILQTNVFAGGVGGREQRINLWFDPRRAFHSYGVVWNHNTLSMYVDEVLIRVFHNHEAHGQPYLSKQPMGVYSSLFDGSQWATRGGLDKINFAHGPFHAHYTDYVLDACVVDGANPFANSHCMDPSSKEWWNSNYFHKIPDSRIGQMNWVKRNFMVYDYCTDTERFPMGMPFECTFDGHRQ